MPGYIRDIASTGTASRDLAWSFVRAHQSQLEARFDGTPANRRRFFADLAASVAGQFASAEDRADAASFFDDLYPGGAPQPQSLAIALERIETNARTSLDLWPTIYAWLLEQQ